METKPPQERRGESEEGTGVGEPTNIREQVFKGGVSADILRCAFPAAFQGTF
jgi:hypothetical protein